MSKRIGDCVHGFASGCCDRGCDRAPTIELPQPTGDAISREDVLRSLHRVASQTSVDSKSRSVMVTAIESVESLPSISPKYGVEDVQPGIEFKLGQLRYRTQKGAIVRTSEDGCIDIISMAFEKLAVAAMLNAADSVTFPVGHPRNPKAEEPQPPTLLEVVKAFMATSTKKTKHYEELKAAIEREEGK